MGSGGADTSARRGVGLVRPRPRGRGEGRGARGCTRQRAAASTRRFGSACGLQQPAAPPASKQGNLQGSTRTEAGKQACVQPDRPAAAQLPQVPWQLGSL